MGDLREHRGRFLLAVFAMSIGIFQITALLYAYSILNGTLGTMYGRTRPASASLTTDSVDDAVIDSVRAMPGVMDAEARPVIVGRVRVGRDDWVPAIFYVIRDFRNLRIDTFELQRAAAPPGPGDVLLEQTALQVARVRRGDSITVRIPGTADRTVRLAGTVHAEGLPPAWMEHMVPGFIGWDSALRGGGQGESRQIRIVVAEDALDEGHIRDVAEQVRARLESAGHRVTWVNVPLPGRHPHADQMAAFLYLLGAFGLLGFLLSTVLVAGMIQGLLSEQIRQVGIMKAIGATTGQVAALYLAQVSLLAGAALCLGVPPGLAAGRGLARFFADILNGHITNNSFPIWLLALELVVGLAVPLLITLGPVLQASRISIHDALNAGANRASFGRRQFDRLLVGIPWLSRPLALSVRTTFLQRGRLALTVGMLALGGAMFMASLNVSSAWKQSVNRDFDRRHYDLHLGLPEPAPIETIERAIATIPGIVRAEYWPEAAGFLATTGGTAGAHVSVIGPDPESRLLDLKSLAGRWLRPGDSTGVVINQAIASRDSSLRVGNRLRVRLAGRAFDWPILGIVQEMNPTPTVYAPPELVARASDLSAGLTRSARIVLRDHDEAAGRAASVALEQALAREHLQTRGIQRLADSRQAILDHLVILLAVLAIASVMVLFVGAVGLTSALTLNVSLRTREIGILGALGATPTTISRQIWAEGVLVGLLSWGLATILAAPLSYALETATGRIFFKVPLDFYMSPGPALLWLVVVVGLASASSFYPARRAARLTVREALATA